MTVSTYQQKLEDPRWRELRTKIIGARGNRCQDCGATGCVVDIHHRTYARGAEPWEYPEENFVVCCRPCHTIREVATLSRIVFQTAEPVVAKSFLLWLMNSPGAMIGERLLQFMGEVKTNG